MKVKINPGCIGCGMCASTCPEVFKMNEDNLAEVFADVTVDIENSVRQARDNCPVQVIEIEE
ncbi:ferredoxin [Anaerorhabdus sp.]|jgi:ferredoxin|uniref:ferredoxin n=1 Tax=Anaerorhabdus sp. TaxID=1872524 RepID=UPI002FC98B76